MTPKIQVFTPFVSHHFNDRVGKMDIRGLIRKVLIPVNQTSKHYHNFFYLNLANIDHQTIDGEGQKVIHYAAKYGSMDVMEYLFEKGVNLNERDHDHRTPLYEAARKGLSCY